MDFVELMEKFGLPVMLVMVVIGFFWKGLWPFVVKQIEQNRTDLTKEREEFIKLLQAKDKHFDEVLSILSKLTTSVDQLHSKIEKAFDKVLTYLRYKNGDTD
jgi:uncharacterized membrane-anchored protein YhcB (DUF1043 family)